MAWHIVEKFLEQVAEHSTLVGKFWVTFFFILRFLMVVSIADTVFGDEQGAFVCNTLTPGCENVCFNEFSPISLIRLWALQVLSVALPTIIFMIYTAHKLTKIAQAKKLRKDEQDKKKADKEKAKALREESRKRALIERRKREEGGPPDYNEAPDKPLTDVKESLWDCSTTKELNYLSLTKEKKKDDDDDDKQVVATKLDSDTPSRLMIAYVAQVICRLALEIGFTIVQFNIYVFKFWIPELFKCSRWPCPNVVDCFVSRPKEKTVMLWVMFGTSLIMIILNIVEIYHLGLKKIWEAWKSRGQDITKEYKLKNNMPSFGHIGGGGQYGARYPRGYPQAVGIRVGYARSSLSGEGGNDFNGDRFI